MHDHYKVSIEHFSVAEQKAQSAAQQFTTKALALATAKETITLEKLTGTESYGDIVVEVLQDLHDALNTISVTGKLDDLQAIAGRYGAILTAVFKTGERPKTLGEWVMLFENLYRLLKK